jgi:hypothetical protein
MTRSHASETNSLLTVLASRPMRETRSVAEGCVGAFVLLQRLFGSFHRFFLFAVTESIQCLFVVIHPFFSLVVLEAQPCEVHEGMFPSNVLPSCTGSQTIQSSSF